MALFSIRVKKIQEFLLVQSISGFVIKESSN